MNQGDIIIYQTPDGNTTLDVKLGDDTVWLSLNEISNLFGRDKSVVSRHINNIFREGELVRQAVVANNATTDADGKTYNIDYYNLDVIISVGYRVKSIRGTQFRIWANGVLKEYLLKGYAIKKDAQVRQLEDALVRTKVLIDIAARTGTDCQQTNDILRVLRDYTYALDTLDRYDYQSIEIDNTTNEEKFHATYENAIEALAVLCRDYANSSLFGQEKDESFKSSIGAIYQTFGGQELYPSIEEKAAMLLYLVIKNHSFSDGNKRIAAYLFVWFLEKNGILYKEDGTKLIENNALVALTLMIAESLTEEKDVMVKVVVSLINRNN